ncbi:hypothetical protein [Halomonas sp. TD01]|uniref:hypothetical protein n=1 Tax=Halomonas sp. TD01 TaxID=999141 RepID=UPI000214E06C|nr:hypothetical protein [Halomonas sp. TD01]EGP19892.1 hypothetical protein GME_09354 [Halomonas sp. TD01]CAH1042909.1 hypothetical protein HPTD01_1387 [Halomonas sp. TD01]
MLGLWTPGCELYSETIYLSHNEEELALELIESGSLVSRIHRVSSDADELIAPISMFLSTRLGIDLSIELQLTNRDFIHWYQITSSLLQKEDSGLGDIIAPSGMFPYFTVFREFVQCYLKVKSCIQRSCMRPGLSSKDFISNWWDDSIDLTALLDELSFSIKKLPEKGSFLENIERSIGFLREFLKKFNDADTSSKHVYLSGIAYGLALKAVEREEHDLVLLFTQRSLDFAVHSIALKKDVVSAGKHGLVYKQYLGEKSLPSLMKTVEYLQKQNILFLGDDENYDLRRINNARNNLLITHSSYSISSEEVKRYHSEARKINLSIVEVKSTWSEGLKAVTSLKGITLDVLFEVHEFSSYVVTMNKEKLLENYGLSDVNSTSSVK